MRKDIMVDIETLGKKEGASVFQISAMSFNIENGEIYDQIDLIGDISKYEKLNVDGDTLKWWLNENKELLTNLLNKGVNSESELFIKFYMWLKLQTRNEFKDIYLWGNGILFDNAKIQNKFNTLTKIKYPIHYKNDRDVRTILELASFKSGLSENEIKDSVINQEEVKHNALDDVKYQIRLVSKCFNILKG